VVSAVNVRGKINGQMFMVSPEVAVTAAHVLDSGGCLVGKWDGLWTTELCWRDEELDVAVVCTRENVRPEALLDPPSSYPVVSDSQLLYGDDVAILGLLQRASARDGPMVRSIITGGMVAYINVQPLRYAIHGAFAEPGFSGGPVVAPDGRVVAVLTGANQMSTLGDFQIPLAFPVVAPLFGCRQKILEAVSTHSNRGASM
jgi:hypothetical protein